MADSAPETLETILRQCEAAAPDPWYPKVHAEMTGVPRDSLDAPLEKLRMAGLVRLTEWVQGRGQGYVLTPEGIHVLKNGRELARLRDGRIKQSTPVAHVKPRAARWSAWDRGENIREVFLNPPTPVVSRAILFAYIGVFVAGLYLAQQRNVPANLYLYGNTKDPAVQANYSSILSTLGAVNGFEIVHGQWWRLLTACFVHIGIVHLALNSWCLYATGRYIEPMWGAGRYIILYVLSGIVGSCVALMTSTAGLAGGSGALFGVFASEIVWFLLNRGFLPSPLVAAWQRNIVTNIILMVFISLIPGVSWGGHLGGAIAGIVVALLLHYQRYGLGMARWLALAALPLVPVAGVGALIYTMNTKPQWIALRQYVRTEGAREDRHALGERWRRDAADADQAAQRAVESASIVLQKHPGRRTPEDKGHAIDILSKARASLERAIDEMSAAPAFRDPEIEEARQVVIEYLQASADLCGLSERFLRENQNLLNANLKGLQEQQAKVEELRNRWFGIRR